MLKIRRPLGRLIFNMGIAIPGKTVFLIETAPSHLLEFPFIHSPIRLFQSHDDLNKWKHFRWYWPFVRGIHRSPMDSPHKGQWSGALMISLFCAWKNGWANTRDAGDLRHHIFLSIKLSYKVTWYDHHSTQIRPPEHSMWTPCFSLRQPRLSLQGSRTFLSDDPGWHSIEPTACTLH